MYQLNFGSHPLPGPDPRIFIGLFNIARWEFLHNFAHIPEKPNKSLRKFYHRSILRQGDPR